MSLSGIKANIQGRVQGVYFRKYTCKKAIELNITGWVQNEADGSVSLEAFGNPHDLELFSNWLKKGPTLARVDKADIHSIPYEEYKDFSIQKSVYA